MAKLRKVLKENPQVHTVIIEFTDKHVNPKMEEWIWDDQHVSLNYRKYAAFLTVSDHLLLLRHNWKAFIVAQAETLQENLRMLLDRDAFKKRRWGGFSPSEEPFTRDTATSESELSQADADTEGAPCTLKAFGEIAALCDDYNIKLLFLRCPHHSSYSGDLEERYLRTLNKEFPETSVLDYKDFPLKTEDFIDASHLSKSGSQHFSVFIQTGIERGEIPLGETKSHDP